jgi:hypothetical protein
LAAADHVAGLSVPRQKSISRIFEMQAGKNKIDHEPIQNSMTYDGDCPMNKKHALY